MIKIYDLSHECQTNDDGKKVFQVIAPLLIKGEIVELSFEKIRSLPSSFVNTAFIDLLEVTSFENIKKLLRFTHTTPQINDVIKRRFQSEMVRAQKKLSV